MRILGIHDGHTSTACLVENGKIIHNVSEERFTKVKGQGGFPKNAIEFIYKNSNISAKDIDLVGLVGYVKPLTSISDYTKGRQNLFPKIIKYLPTDPRGFIKKYVNQSRSKRLKDKKLINCFKSVGINIDKVQLMEHHQTHADTAYYMSHYYQKKEECLVFTLDGSGDGLSGTVSKVNEKGNWERLKEISSYDSLGIVFGRVTQLLAMKPWEHEYKLMGMAPYAKEEYAEEAYKIFTNYLQLDSDGLGLKNPTKLWGNSLLKDLRKAFKEVRFDNISAGIQLLHERLVTSWVENWIKNSGIKKIAVAGGCFMNIKANKNLMELSCCDDVFIMPSGGDESCALGACLSLQSKNSKIKIETLLDLYWGPRNEEKSILRTLNKYKSKLTFEKLNDIEAKTAELLADHKIIGRVSGRMEWGARALGNRSIIANPSRVENLRDLNIAIKMRDFWMPFAPSILWEMRKDYAIYPKENSSCLMTMGFDGTALAKEHLKAAIHPYDQSMRPQFVKKEYNPRYHKLILEFKKRTNIGAVLNTSFNLHGMPIVNDTEDAVYTLLNSGLDYITVDDYLVWKR